MNSQTDAFHCRSLSFSFMKTECEDSKSALCKTSYANQAAAAAADQTASQAAAAAAALVTSPAKTKYVNDSQNFFVFPNQYFYVSGY